MRLTPLALLAAVLATLAGGGPATAAPVGIHPAAAQPVIASVVAVGSPGADLDGQTDAGAVEVRHAAGSLQSLVASDHRAGDRFGTATAVVDVDGDAYPDLAVGAPGHDLPGVPDAGAVYLYRGSATGLHQWRVLTQGAGGVPGSAQPQARFGSVLSSYQRPALTLVVGEPGWDVGAAVDAGAVAVVDFTVAVDPQVSGILLTEDSPGFPGTSQPGDRFGAAVSAGTGHFAAGAPGKTVSGAQAAGAVFFRDVDDQADYTMLSQDTPGMPGAAERGDHFGTAVYEAAALLWIGVPGEDVGSLNEAGMANTFGDVDEDGVMAEPGPSYTQNSDTAAGGPVAGTAEAGDLFGAALASFRPDEDSDVDTVLVGVPGEDIGSVGDAGMVDEIWGKGASLTQNTTAGIPETGDRFGATLRAWTDFPAGAEPDLLVGAPGEDAGAGAVVVVGAGADIWKQVTRTPEPGDGYGTAVASTQD